MPTIDEIRKENERLRISIESKREFIRINSERERLLKEQAQLRRMSKLTPEMIARRTRNAKMINKATKDTGNFIKKAAKGFMNFAQKFAQAEERRLREEARRSNGPRRKSSSTNKPRTSSKKKTSKRRR